MTQFIMIGHFQIFTTDDGNWIAHGSGSSGIVTRAQDTSSGRFIAMKIIPCTLRPEDTPPVVKQLQELYSSTHPGVVDFMGADYFPQKGCILIANEYMDLASLKDVMARVGPLPEVFLGFATSQVLNALVYLHRDRRLIHRDIKPSNILLNSSGMVKICDFGMSTTLASTLDPAHTWVGSTTYMSPERISGLQYIWNSDVWSLGISLVELANGDFPYKSNHKNKRMEMVDLLDQIIEEAPPQLDAARFSPEFCDFIACALRHKKEERPNADVLLGHPFVGKYQAADITPFLEQVIAAGAR
mmetsp:Transcript_35376/g.83256  ORF Transcript_35376/g.83256 Transcript_35376/m.83256 type:complete len:300 (-) Transcript_35376:64-963(-)